MTEKLCLRWNGFQEDISNKIGSLKDDPDFTDVTLVCDDGTQVEAHKVILAASSPFFQKLLKRNQHTHPLIYMRKVKSEDLLALVDFLYLGEATVNQESLESFLLLGAELQLEGLMDPKLEDSSPPKAKLFSKANKRFEDKTEENLASDNHVDYANVNIGTTFVGVKTEKIDTTLTEEKNIEKVSFSSLDDLAETVKSMVRRSQNLEELQKRGLRASTCKVCGKEGDRKNIKGHIERYHLGKISVPCNVCNEKCTSGRALRSHYVKCHDQ